MHAVLSRGCVVAGRAPAPPHVPTHPSHRRPDPQVIALVVLRPASLALGYPINPLLLELAPGMAVVLSVAASVCMIMALTADASQNRALQQVRACVAGCVAG